MIEMFPTPEELTPEQAKEHVTALLSNLTRVLDAMVRGAANKARAEALDEALAVTMTAPYRDAEQVAMRIHTIERRSHY